MNAYKIGAIAAGAAVLGGTLIGAAMAQLGPLNPPSGPVADTGPSLADVASSSAGEKALCFVTGSVAADDVTPVSGLVILERVTFGLGVNGDVNQIGRVAITNGLTGADRLKIIDNIRLATGLGQSGAGVVEVELGVLTDGVTIQNLSSSGGLPFDFTVFYRHASMP